MLRTHRRALVMAAAVPAALLMAAGGAQVAFASSPGVAARARSTGLAACTTKRTE